MLGVGNVRGVIVAMIVLSAAAMLGTRAAVLVQEHRTALDRARAISEDMALLLEEYAKRTFETSDLVLDTLARNVVDAGGAAAVRGSEPMHRFLVDLSRMSSSGDFYAVVDADGRPTALSFTDPAPDVSFGDQSWFQAHQAGADQVVGQAFVGRITGEILFTYSRALRDPAGVLTGAVQVAIRPNFLQEVAGRRSGGIAADRYLRLAIWTDDGALVARTSMSPDAVTGSIAGSPIFTLYAQDRAGMFEGRSPIDGEMQIVSFRRLERWPVVVTASIPRAEALATFRQSLGWSVAAALVMFALLGGLTVAGLRLVARDEAAEATLRRLNGELGAANSQLHQALDDRMTLLKEIHHRVRNNLAVTSSLLRLQARSFTDPTVRAAFRDTEDRLRSISLLHETLYQGDAAGNVRLDDYLSRLAVEVAAAHGSAQRKVDLAVEVEPIEMSIDRAMPLGLAVTEALSNAYKHAFGDGDGGRIVLSAAAVEDGLEVTVRDTGRGRPADLPTGGDGRSLGSRLIETFATQLSASVTYENDGGTVFRLRVPHCGGQGEARAAA